MSGYLGSLSDRQQAALDQHLEWRKENGVDDMLHSYEIPELVKENFPGAFLHPGKDGRPVWIFPVGLDVHVLKAASYTLHILEELYPESVETFIIINAPSFFPILWKFLRTLMSQRTADKFEVYGKEDGWKERLLEIVDAAILPAHWGGNMVGPDGDPMCRHKVNYGGRFEEGATSASYDSVFDEKDAQQQTIGRRDRWELAVDVAEAGARLSWRFQTATGDLAFGLRDRCGQALVPLQRLEACSLVPQEGAWHCDTPGTYVLEFDNTYSWLNDKTLAYIVNVDSPEQFP
ncbi:hypothetical protein HPB49_015688 [Dermacentor silvarum]|uniref:Uncharacterized protein n=1 Tax=Dermacentor silvarum TaxID=543639 RepID=A0ACB8CA13_DERSI|nr:hypothetical protein HPB49_015688 [Dermacentor silvarum]